MDTIKIAESTLTDGSKVYSVEIFGRAFDAISETDAMQLAEKVKLAVDAHTNTSTEIWLDY